MIILLIIIITGRVYSKTRDGETINKNETEYKQKQRRQNPSSKLEKYDTRDTPKSVYQEKLISRRVTSPKWNNGAAKSLRGSKNNPALFRPPEHPDQRPGTPRWSGIETRLYMGRPVWDGHGGSNWIWSRLKLDVLTPAQAGMLSLVFAVDINITRWYNGVIVIVIITTSLKISRSITTPGFIAVFK